MKLSISDSYAQMSIEAAKSTARQLIKEPYTVLGLPTGNTPKKFYKQMVAYYEADLVDFSEVTTINLDEFYLIEPNHPQSYRKYMEDRFYSKVNLKERNYHIPDGTTEKLQKECKNYDRLISDSVGIDLQILGIGKMAT
ncbi:6-phosphogluconolactonase [Candidatus Bipolaricaulota bacterium]|nr:6-phosphogluconolactonase [Candidatus Bipolaricaulota bacterium]